MKLVKYTGSKFDYRAESSGRDLIGRPLVPGETSIVADSDVEALLELGEFQVVEASFPIPVDLALQLHDFAKAAPAPASAESDHSDPAKEN